MTVLDVNDNPPNFIRQPYNFEIKEGMKVGTQVDTVTATDLDQDPVVCDLGECLCTPQGNMSVKCIPP